VADELPRLATVSALEGIEGVPGQRRGDEFAARFSKESAGTWAARLTQIGISAQVVMTVYELMEDEAVQERGLSVGRDHPGVGTVRNVCSLPRLSSTPVSLAPAPAVGWHTLDVLEEAGIDQFDALVAKAAASGGRKDLSLG
jgi:crotonobetainyl-CoA:carnitine CoA-transferase CaiB-like acyl-CoA transferase